MASFQMDVCFLLPVAPNRSGSYRPAATEKK